jgi:hypothetical protein
MIMAILDATDLETTATYAPETVSPRMRKAVQKHDHLHATAGTVYGCKLIVLIDIRTKAPLAVTADDRVQAIVGEQPTCSC